MGLGGNVGGAASVAVRERWTPWVINANNNAVTKYLMETSQVFAGPAGYFTPVAPGGEVFTGLSIDVSLGTGAGITQRWTLQKSSNKGGLWVDTALDLTIPQNSPAAIYNLFTNVALVAGDMWRIQAVFVGFSGNYSAMLGRKVSV